MDSSIGPTRLVQLPVQLSTHRKSAERLLAQFLVPERELFFSSFSLPSTTESRNQIERIEPSEEAMGTNDVQMKERTGTAGARVTGTVELLEMILLCLPMQEIFRAQFVQRHFKAVIAGSEKLKTALFMISEPQTTPLYIQINPLLRRMPIFEYCDIRVRLVAKSPFCLPSGYTRPISKLTDMPGTFQVEDDRSFALDIWKADPVVGGRRTPPLYGSWMDMHLSQPACRTVVHIRRRGKFVRVGAGIYTLGDLAKMLGPRKLGVEGGLRTGMQEDDRVGSSDDGSDDGADSGEVLVYNYRHPTALEAEARERPS